jgi:hypothetical protein
VTISGASGGGAAEVLVSGGDEERPPRSRWRAAAAVATVALLLGGVALSRGDSEPPPPVSQATDLALVETGGALNLRWGYGGRLDVQLPLLLRNLDEEMTISSVALDGTSLVQPAVEVALVPDGRLPVTLRQAMTCPKGAASAGRTGPRRAGWSCRTAFSTRSPRAWPGSAAPSRSSRPSSSTQRR